MNPIYDIMESRHRWLILSGQAFTAACLGSMVMLAYNWPHTVELIWLYAGLIAAACFLVMAILKWKREAEELLQEQDAASSQTSRLKESDATALPTPEMGST